MSFKSLLPKWAGRQNPDMADRSAYASLLEMGQFPLAGDSETDDSLSFDEQETCEKSVPTDNRSCLATFRNVPTYVLWVLLPSPLARLCGAPGGPDAPSINHTSYLNGVRGLAAFMVFITHWIERFYGHEAGYTGTPPNDNLVQLPLIRLYHSSGHFDVAVFFVLSGFVLSWGPLVQAHSKGADSNFKPTLARLLRRPIRLFLPALPVALISGVIASLGWYYDYRGWIANPFLPLSPDGRMMESILGWWKTANPLSILQNVDYSQIVEFPYVIVVCMYSSLPHRRLLTPNSRKTGNFGPFPSSSRAPRSSTFSPLCSPAWAGS
jgi:hypothetical protein